MYYKEPFTVQYTTIEIAKQYTTLVMGNCAAIGEILDQTP